MTAKTMNSANAAQPDGGAGELPPMPVPEHPYRYTYTRDQMRRYALAARLVQQAPSGVTPGMLSTCPACSKGVGEVCATCAGAAQSAAEPSGVAPTLEAIADKVRELLGDIYHCTRVWSAWRVGTMTERDFEPAEESSLADEIAAEVSKLFPAFAPPSAESKGGDALLRLRFFRDLTRPERFKVFHVLGVMPDGVTVDEMNESVERRLLDMGLAAIRSHLSGQNPAATAERVYVGVHQCDGCGHVGINDEHPTDGKCSQCEWRGEFPNDAQCPACGGSINAVCPKCEGEYVCIAEDHVEVSETPATLPHLSGRTEPAPASEATEFCWLIELFEPGEGSNSLGFYHTGFTDLHGNSRSTQNPHEAKRYESKALAIMVAAKLDSMRGVWRAVEHGFATHPAPQVSDATGKSDTAGKADGGAT